MANISNVQRAFNQINTKSLEYKGILYRDVFMSFFNHAVGNFNLNEKQIEELKTLNYSVQVQDGSDESPEKSTETDKTESGPVELTVLTEIEEVSLLQKLESLEKQVINLTNALARIGTLTGYGNHLREYGIDRWQPGKKDMNKYG